MFSKKAIVPAYLAARLYFPPKRPQARLTSMDLNRNQFLMIGLLVLLLGVQFRMVDHFVLNAKASKFVEEKLGKKPAAPNVAPAIQAAASETPVAVSRRTVKPPHWLGWCLLSVGGVLVLHSLAMRRPA